MTVADSWRGVATEQVDDVTASLSQFLRGRSRRLLAALLRPYKREMWKAFGFILAFNLASMAGPFLVKLGIDRGIPPLVKAAGGSGSPRWLLLAVGLLALAGIVQALTDMAFTLKVGHIGQDVLYDLRGQLFDHFQSLSLSFHERYTSGRVISRLTSDVDAISELLAGGLDVLVWALLTMVSVAALMVILDPGLALVVFAIFPLVVAVTIWFRINATRAYRSIREAVALVIVHFVESLGGIRAVQAFRREGRNDEIFQEVDDRYRRANMWSSRLSAIYGPAVKMLGNLSVAAVLLIGGSRVLKGEITVGVLAAFLLYLRRFFDPVQDLSQFYNTFQSAAAALEKLSGVLEEEPAVAPPEIPVPLGVPRGDITFESVRFGYREAIVIPGLDLHIPAGQTVALVGETGAGKSTVARLIARFYDPNEGRIALDGIDLRDLMVPDLRRAIVMVTQESFLFSGSVADNIAFGRPTATRHEIEEAARVLGAHEFISALPEGFDTDVRKRGGRLSAGQRQLVAFARAFLADPAVLILDEATSSLDIPSERLVQRALRTLLAERTAVIIAHRLSTVEIADRVLVIDGGRIVEDGTPADLMSGTGRYHDLHQAWLDSLAS
ncbi:MAG: ATP-binding cassette, subfamily bacterial [Actinomycetota bacterium]|jgi:ABC-type multidrug transport system fused ATPase/permease subunit|nr:ATP-binding cassette, subfamily bacterial [Actinomycetota bacterium]